MYYIFLFICFFSFLCAQESFNTQSLHRFMLANYYQFNDQLKDAAYWYDQLQSDKVGTHFYVGYVPFLDASNNINALMPLIPKLDIDFKNNIEIQSIVAAALEKAGKADEAQNRLIRLNDLNKSNQELAFKVAQIYLARQEPENALTVINSLLNNSPRKPNNFIFCFLKSQIYLLMNKKEDALTAIKQCVELYPKFDKGWLLYAVIEEQAGNIEHAISGYTTFLESTNEVHNDVEQHLLQLAIKQKFGSLSSSQAKSGLERAMKLFDRKEYRNAMQELSICVNTSKESMQAQLAKVQILLAQKEYDKAIDAIVQSASECNQDVWPHALYLAYKTQAPLSKVLKGFDRIIKKNPKNLHALLYKADILLKENENQKALPVLLQANDLCKDNHIKARILYQASIIYYENNQFEPMQKILSKACEADMRFAPAFNLLAYFYATQGKNLEKAELFAQKALNIDPSNPHFLDTQALIDFELKKYDKALIVLEKIAFECPKDIVILEHLSKTLYKLGKREQALSALHTAALAAQSQQEKTKINSLIAQVEKNS